MKWKKVKLQTRKTLLPWNDIAANGSERKMAKHTYRKHEGVVTVYESLSQTAYKQQHGNVLLRTPSCSLLFSFVLSVKTVKARLTAAPGRRSAISGWRKRAPQRPENDPTLYRFETYSSCLFPRPSAII